MRVFLKAFVFSILLVWTASAGMSYAASKAMKVDVVASRFGVIVYDPQDESVDIEETLTVSAIPGQAFGWFVIFRTQKPTIVWREEFELPEPPPTWGSAETLGQVMISPDRRSAVTERIIRTSDGFFVNVWRYAPGDPVGAHQIRVYIDGTLVLEAKFEIKPEKVEYDKAWRKDRPST